MPGIMPWIAQVARSALQCIQVHLNPGQNPRIPLYFPTFHPIYRGTRGEN